MRALEREAKTQRDLLESYLAKYREATARESINAAPPEARIISRATAAIKPSYPKKLPMILIAAFAGFALSAGFIVTGALLAAPSPGFSRQGYQFMPQVGAPTLVPPLTAAPITDRAPMHSGIDEIARSIEQAGGAGQRVAVVGSEHNVGTTVTAIALARRLAEAANVVLVDCAFTVPNLSLISNQPEAPGIAELVHGKASFGDIVTRDQQSRLHIVATGKVGDAAALSRSPMVATVIEALARSYQYVVLDLGAADDGALELFARLAPRAVLVTRSADGEPARRVSERLAAAGFGEVTVLVNGRQAVAA